MIRAGSPRDELAALLGGVPHGRDSIIVDGIHAIWVSVGGVVRVNGVPLGRWHDGADALAAAYRAAIEEAVAS